MLSARVVAAGFAQLRQIEWANDSVRPTVFRSGARGLHVPTTLTREPGEHEARKRRANERPRVACTVLLG